VNNAPTLGGTTANLAVNDNAPVNPFTALTVTDADTQEMLISVTILNGVSRVQPPDRPPAGRGRSSAATCVTTASSPPARTSVRRS